MLILSFDSLSYKHPIVCHIVPEILSYKFFSNCGYLAAGQCTVSLEECSKKQDTEGVFDVSFSLALGHLASEVLSKVSQWM